MDNRNINNKPPLKKVNYYDGLFMKAQNFTTDQDFHIRSLSLHNEFMHKDQIGVVQGLVVTVNKQGAQYSLNISNGYAQCSRTVDYYQNIVGLLWQGGNVPIDKSVLPGLGGSSTFYVAIAYGEKRTDWESDQGKLPIYIEQVPVIEFSTEKPTDNCVILAKVTLPDETVALDERQIAYVLTDYITMLGTPGNPEAVNIAEKNLVIGEENQDLSDGLLQVNGLITSSGGLKTATNQLNATGLQIGEDGTNAWDSTSLAAKAITVANNITLNEPASILQVNGTLNVVGESTLGALTVDSLTITGGGGGETDDTAGKVYRDCLVEGSDQMLQSAATITTNIPLDHSTSIMYKLIVEGYASKYGGFSAALSGMAEGGSINSSWVVAAGAATSDIEVTQSVSGSMIQVDIKKNGGTGKLGYLGISLSAFFYNINFNDVDANGFIAESEFTS